MFGEPGNRDKQRRVVQDVLEAFRTIREPGGHVELAYRWEAPPVMYRGKSLREGPNA
jgi:hypothetical protein